MTPKDLLLALLVIVVWGLNFVVIKVGLHGMPPMLMGALRFMLAAFRRSSSCAGRRCRCAGCWPMA